MYIVTSSQKTAETDLLLARQYLGSSSLSQFFDDYEHRLLPYTASNVTTGNITLNADSTVTVATGGTAGSQGAFYYGDATYSGKLPAGSSQNFWLSARFKINVVPSGGGILAPFGCNSEASYFGCNHGAAGLATKYSAVFAGSANNLISTVSMQTANYVTMRVWRVGTTTSLSVDGEAAVTGNCYLTNSRRWGPLTFNGAAAVDMALTVDWVNVITPRP